MNSFLIQHDIWQPIIVEQSHLVQKVYFFKWHFWWTTIFLNFLNLWDISTSLIQLYIMGGGASSKFNFGALARLLPKLTYFIYIIWSLADQQCQGCWVRSQISKNEKEAISGGNGISITKLGSFDRGVDGTRNGVYFAKISDKLTTWYHFCPAQ